MTRFGPDPASNLLIEALMPAAQAHREGSLDRAQAILAVTPEAARADIWVAAACGELEAASAFLRDDPTLASRPGGPRAWVPLLYAAFSRFLRLDAERALRIVEIAHLLLQAEADPNAFWVDPSEAEGNRESVLYGAVGVANNVELARLLIEAGADPNDGETPYHMVEHPGVPCAELVFPSLTPESRGIALTHLLDYDDLEGLTKLLALGADPNGPSPFKNKPLHQAAWRGRERPFFDALLAAGAKVDQPNGDERTAYTLAARSGRAEIVDWLRAAGASTAMQARDRFVSAAALGDAPTARRLVATDPSLLEQLDGIDRSAICDAAGAGNTAGVRTMLDVGWEVNTPGVVWGETPLHRAAIENRLETVRWLLESGADLTCRDRSYRSSPLGWAAHGGHATIVAELTRDPSCLDLADAAEHGFTERVLDLLGDDVDAPTPGADRGVLLRIAAHTGNETLAHELVARGADVSLRNRNGDSALDVAEARNVPKVAELLRQAAK